VPFDDRTLGTVCMAVDRATFTPPSAFLADATPSLDAWFRRAFARARSNRFASAVEMREASHRRVGAVPARKPVSGG
jgi:hypothetical protein